MKKITVCLFMTCLMSWASFSFAQNLPTDFQSTLVRGEAESINEVAAAHGSGICCQAKKQCSNGSQAYCHVVYSKEVHSCKCDTTASGIFCRGFDRRGHLEVNLQDTNCY